MPLEDFRAFVEQVRGANPCSDVVGDDAELKRKGRGLYCCSPLRPGDRTPSFCVFDDSDSWYDFGTNDGGDVFKYVIDRDRVTFREAVDVLAKRAGLEYQGGGGDAIDAETRAALNVLLERRWVVELIDEAIDYYHRSLPRRVRKFLHEHYGFTDETIDRLRIGWATGALKEYMHDQLGHEFKRLEKTGLFLKRRNGNLVDFYEQRIVFPYLVDGRAHYSIARRMEGHTPDDDFEKAKYKKQLTHSQAHTYVSEHVDNSILYGTERVRGRGELLLIVEGVTDAASAVQEGFAVRSPVTTRYRRTDAERFIEACKRYDKVVICNDAETSGAGLAGALTMAAELFRAGVDVRVAQLPRPADVDKVDLNSYLKDHGSEALATVIGKAKRYPVFLIDRIDRKSEPDELEKELAVVYEVVAVCGATEREAHIGKIAQRFKISKRIVRREVESHVPAEERAAGVEKLHGQVQEDENGFYFVRIADDTIILSSFTLRMRERIMDEDEHELACCDVHTVRGRTFNSVVFPHNSWVSRRDFLRALPSVDLQFTGNDDNVQGIKKIISEREVPQMRGVRTLGYYYDKKIDRSVWVTPKLVIGSDGVIEDTDLRYIGTGAIADRLDYAIREPEHTRSLAQRVLPQVLKLNTPEVVLPTLGWFCAASVAPWLREQLGHFSILWFFGTQGSGKTTLLRDVFWPLFGVSRGRDPFSVTDTQFTMISTLASTASIAMMFDEFKLDANRTCLDRICRLARRVYGGEIEQRGRSNQTLVTYRLAAPMVVAGEMLPTDPALVERLVCVSPLKTSLTDERAAALARLAAEPFSELAGDWVRFVLGRSLEHDLSEARRILSQLADAGDVLGLTPRMMDNMLIAIFGLVLFEAWAEHHSVELPEIDMHAAFREMVANVRGEGGVVKDSFDRFLESLSTYAHTGLIENGKHYTIIDSQLHLHLPSCYEVYLYERKRTGQPDETNGLNALRRVLREKTHGDGSYVLNTHKTVRMSETRGRVRTVCIEPGSVPETLDFEMFPQTVQRKWGGGSWDGDRSDRDWTSTN